MPPDAPPAAAEPEPDHFFVGRLADRLPDGGPRYAETPADPATARGALAEPLNAVTAAVFVVIALYWLVRVWGRVGRHPFLAGCVPVLFVGGVGGTLYHATRAARVFFLMDVLPISLLGAAGAVYLSVRLGRSVGVVRVAVMAAGLLGAYLFVNGVLFRGLRPSNPNLTVNLSYAALATILLIPLVAVLVRTRFRHGGWVLSALLLFANGWFCRLVDREPWLPLANGSHWLWHLFGAGATFAVAQYFLGVTRSVTLGSLRS